LIDFLNFCLLKLGLIDRLLHLIDIWGYLWIFIDRWGDFFFIFECYL